MSIHIIGAGGIGSWLIPSLLLLEPDKQLTVWDGDDLEERNLDRQKFTPEQIGMNKAEAIADLYGKERIIPMPQWFTMGADNLFNNSWLFCCADNNRARRDVLSEVDRVHCRAIIAGNEYEESDAYFYEHIWSDSPLDPRVYLPNLLEDDTPSPMRPAGCTGEAQVAHPQLVLANMDAAVLAQRLYYFHRSEEFRQVDEQHWPIRYEANRYQTLTRRGSWFTKLAEAA